MKSWEARKEERKGGRRERWQVGIKSVNQTPKSPEILNKVVKRGPYLGHMLHHDIQEDRYTSSYLMYYCSRTLHPLHSQDCKGLKIKNKR